MDAQRYDPRRYWSDRLGRHQGLRGTGHVSYSEGYNKWLYRAKGRALSRALRGIEPGHALDIGSGTGWVIAQLQERGFEVEGCDVAPDAVARLRDGFPGLEIFELSLGTEPIPRPDAGFDLVTALDVLYHLTDDRAWGAALAEIARVLSPGGRMIATDSFGETELTPSTHVRFRSRDLWLAETERAGLRVTDELPLYRWLSRDPGRGHVLPDRVRGAIEFGLERLVPRRPHMRVVVLSPQE